MMKAFCQAALLLAMAPGLLAAETSLTCAALDIDRVGAVKVDSYRASLAIWLEMDDTLFACDERAVLEGLGAPMRRSWDGLAQEDLFIVRAAHPGQEKFTDEMSILARGGPYAVVQAKTSATRQDLLRGLWHDHRAEGDGCQRPSIQPLQGSAILAQQSANAAQRGTTVFGPEVADAVAAVDFDRWFSAVETLAAWNRYTHGSEVDDASDWLVSQFTALGLAVTTPTFQVGGTTANNVIGTWTGTSRPDEWFLVGGHYDSISENPSSAAPGAEDNASGCAGVLELARVLIPLQPEATMVFVCYSGEEQGLFGSDDHAGGIVADGDASKIQEVTTMDMIGYSGDADLDVLLETEPAFASILDIYVDAAAEFTTLRTVTSLNAFGSDHVPFLNRNLPALLTIENDWDSYGGYHSTNDLATNITLQMGGQVVQMNAAVLAHQVGVSDSATIFRNGFESGSANDWSGIFP